MTTQKEQSQKKISLAFQRSLGNFKLENLGILLEIQQKALGPGANNAGITYTSMGIHPKSCCIFPLKITATLMDKLAGPFGTMPQEW